MSLSFTRTKVSEADFNLNNRHHLVTVLGFGRQRGLHRGVVAPVDEALQLVLEHVMALGRGVRWRFDSRRTAERDR